QTISWQTSFSGLLAYVFKPNISHGKTGSRPHSSRQTEAKKINEPRNSKSSITRVPLKTF
ncbi:MAG: hypothetical protein MRQ11_01325, partial [Candidatus Midichloria mitochondrii]|nr:hypothetical protein [Candidatus Midichloria mitochondrii]